ncbi:MAG: hypothetical protein KAR47_05915, partial [Planctomycetes bacterium]|nr:hypothetical protein [Planctomycetota bacterium]
FYHHSPLLLPEVGSPYSLWPIRYNLDYIAVKIYFCRYGIHYNAAESILSSVRCFNTETVALVPILSLRMLIRVRVIHHLLNMLSQSSMRAIPGTEMLFNFLLARERLW